MKEGSPYSLRPFHAEPQTRDQPPINLGKLFNLSWSQFLHLQSGGKSWIRWLLSFCDDFFPPWRLIFGKLRSGPLLDSCCRVGDLSKQRQVYPVTGFPDGSANKESACNAGDLGSISVSGRPPWRRKWQPTPVFLPGKYHGQRSLAGYSPWGLKSQI